MNRCFFIAGAQRAGTTYLHQLVSEHPQIEMNQPWWPEPKFFLEVGSERRVGEYFKRYFPSNKPDSVFGEKSVAYMEHQEAAARISQCFPDAKIIFILRDPIERAISNYWYTQNSGLENLQMDTVLTDESLEDRPYDRARITGCAPYHYLKRGRYAGYIKNYLKYFDCSQIKILVHENFVGNAAEVKSLYEFLQVDGNVLPPSINDQLNSYLPPNLVRIKEKTELFLLQYYKNSNAELESLFNLDLNSWRSTPSFQYRQGKCE